MNGNMLIKNASQLITLSGFAAKKGKEMGELGVIHNGAVMIENGRISAVGKNQEVFKERDESILRQRGFCILDASDRAVLPGFVDSHTHFIFAGYRAEEFALRLAGADYMEIMKRGGGILNTVAATRKATEEQLMSLGSKRLDSMLSHGVTTVEGKSGYGLDRDTEIKQLKIMTELNNTHPIDIVNTFLGAHAVPGEYSGNGDAFIAFLIEELMPEVADKNLAEFCDVFCEKKVFSTDQSARLLQCAKRMGLKLKLHADEMEHIGGGELAAELGAVSADHLLYASARAVREMAEAGVVATLLPLTAFSLRKPYARGRYMIDQGCALALATDFNPGSCFSESIPLLIALATINMSLTPEEAITALTINGAAALDRADIIGSIDAGKQADIILLENPSYHFLAYHIGVSVVEKVIKKGKLVFDKKQGGIIHC
ncbi:MAG: imidazolonepropionase [Deltaproteobacteria bacterium]|nr:imidazolonepropionase [Deltaproteobacteria bacterium]